MNTFKGFFTMFDAGPFAVLLCLALRRRSSGGASDEVTIGVAVLSYRLVSSTQDGTVRVCVPAGYNVG